ncbi:MAG: prepilin-type N-terminal cleavage/methylation domain-containing protein [Bdellovibrionales bacterium]|nr:prepilin-type N-terminal cleavage/methylation domain-containing protein [Bdellovibrionales bacterium]
MNSKGFTLIEIVVAIAILAVLSFYTAQSIQRAVQSKVKIQGDIERTSTLRSAIRVIEKDIQMAFNYRDPNIELHNRAGKERDKQKASDKAKGKGKSDDTSGAGPSEASGEGTPGSAEPFKPIEEKILTQFAGTEETINFTSRNNFRTQADSQMSDEMEVGYYVEDCRKRSNSSISTKCLMRRTSNIIDDQIEDGGDSVALIEDVTRFKLRYLGYQENAEWQSQWRSDQGGDDVTKDHFPIAVEVTIEVQDKTKEKSKPTSMTIVAEIRNPNNPIKEEGADGQNQGEPAPGGGLGE